MVARRRGETLNTDQSARVRRSVLKTKLTGPSTRADDARRLATRDDGAMDAPARARRAGRGRGRGRPGRGRGRRGGTTIPRDDARETRERRKIVIRNLPATLAREALEEALRRDGFGALDETFEWWEYANGEGARGDGGDDDDDDETRDDAVEVLRDGAARGDGEGAAREVRWGDVSRARAGRGGTGDRGRGGGEETRARVEYAPSQWTPREFGERYATAGETAPAENALEGTIEEDEDYLKFLGALEAKKKANGATTGAATPKNAESAPRKSTALLEFLWRQRAAAEREKGAGKKSSKKSSKKSGKASQSKTGAKTAAPRGAQDGIEEEEEDQNAEAEANGRAEPERAGERIEEDARDQDY